MDELNFFDEIYRKELVRTDVEFGIYDPGNNQPALTTLDKNHYQARVKNAKRLSVQFVAVDHNIPLLRENGDTDNSCDGMLYVPDDYLCFVELKDKMSDWASDAVGQLQTTIKHFKKHHDCDVFKRRYAFAVNSQRPQFHHSFKEMIQQFRNVTQFNLRFKTEIEL